MLLGALTRAPRTSPLDVAAERAFYGRNPQLAWFFSRLGYNRELIVLFFVLCAGVWLAHGALLDIVVLFAIQTVSQMLVVRIKVIFKRVRPQNWLVRQELDSSFPSGHASTAAVVFGGLLFLFWHVPLPLELRLAGALPLAGIILGIGWSRIALGAHHLTDVLGGYAFGAAWLCGGLWLYLSYGP